jgi:radical SAM protein with 4Fe4S-binding SPASM domain
MKTLEITTRIGCPVWCLYCPQDAIRRAYKSDKQELSLKDFATALKGVPKDVRIDFSGFCEPFLNPDAVKMVGLAAVGHKVTVFTTGLGLLLKDVDALKGIEFDTFELHLKDSKGLSLIPQTPVLKSVLDKIRKEVKNVVEGDHTRIRIISRAGNVKGIPAPERKNGPIECNRVLERFVILPNGDCVLCCMDYGMKHIVGNLFSHTLNEIVNGPVFHSVKTALATDGDVLCRHCEMGEYSK